MTNVAITGALTGAKITVIAMSIAIAIAMSIAIAITIAIAISVAIAITIAVAVAVAIAITVAVLFTPCCFPFSLAPGLALAAQLHRTGAGEVAAQ